MTYDPDFAFTDPFGLLAKQYTTPHISLMFFERQSTGENTGYCRWKFRDGDPYALAMRYCQTPTMPGVELVIGAKVYSQPTLYVRDDGGFDIVQAYMIVTQETLDLLDLITAFIAANGISADG